MSHIETLERWVASSDLRSHPVLRWWPWATLILGVVIIGVGAVLFTPGR